MKCRPFFFYAPLSILLACGDSSTGDVLNAGGSRPDGGTSGPTSTSGGSGGKTGSATTTSTTGAGGQGGGTTAGSGGTTGAAGSGTGGSGGAVGTGGTSATGGTAGTSAAGGGGGAGGAGGRGGTAGSAGNAGSGGRADAGAPGSGCGTRGVGPCRQDLTCIYPPSADCGSNDGGGTCVDTALIDCAPPPAGAAACGCDGKTYMSGCLATLAGVSVKHAGACP